MSADSLAVFKKVIPGHNKTILEQVDFYLKKYAEKFGLTTTGRIAAFMAQAAHETDGFRTLREYASGAAYEGRKDLGNIYKGDGVKFRGRGIFQTTGRYNYGKVSKKIFGDERLLKTPELLEKPEWAVLSALHFWKDRNLNAYADSNDIKGLTYRINGGYNGLADRLKYYASITSTIALSPTIFLTAFLKKKANEGWFWSIANIFRSSSPGGFSYNNYE